MCPFLDTSSYQFSDSIKPGNGRSAISAAYLIGTPNIFVISAKSSSWYDSVQFRHRAFVADARFHLQSLPILIRPQHPNKRLNVDHISRLQIGKVAPDCFGKFQQTRIGFPRKF